MNKNSMNNQMTIKFKILNIFKKPYFMYVKQLANEHHSTKFQMDTSIFDPQKLNFFLQHDA